VNVRYSKRKYVSLLCDGIARNAPARDRPPHTSHLLGELEPEELLGGGAEREAGFESLVGGVDGGGGAEGDAAAGPEGEVRAELGFDVGEAAGGEGAAGEDQVCGVENPTSGGSPCEGGAVFEGEIFEADEISRAAGGHEPDCVRAVEDDAAGWATDRE
jgi:hypothetical protein